MLLFTAHRDALLAPLQALCGIVERRHTLPILSHALLECDGERLSLTVSDGEIQLHGHAAVADGQAFRLCTSARKLLDILRALPAGAALKLEQRREQLLLRAGHSRFQLQTLPAEDFPLLREPAGPAALFTLPQGALKRKLGQILFAMAGQDIRPYLSGLLLQAQGGQLLLVAADGYRLAFQRCALEQSIPDAQWLLPRKAALELSRLLADDERALEISAQEGQMRLELGGYTLRCKLLDARAPDYLRLLPDAHDCELTLPRLPLLEAIQRVAVLSHAKFRQLELDIAPGLLTLRCRNAEQEEAEEKLECDWQGAPLSASFNLQYLLDALSTQAAEALHFGFAQGQRGVLVTSPQEPDFQYLAMPLRG